ncbi:MAG: Rho termination factor N-terminal domain-containing protein [Acholeplasma sp.]|nr:Rho termination factor N-terminal domain-containing protein [Acholeplasma sp.]
MQEASRNVENKERPRRPKKEYNNNNSDRKPYVRRDQQAPAAGSSDLAAKKTSELRDLAKEKNVPGYETMKKADLLEALK